MSSSRCRGQITQGICATYAGSDEHEQDALQESFLRRGGLGFGVSLSTDDAMMSMHLQANHNLSSEEARDAIVLNEPTGKAS